MFFNVIAIKSRPMQLSFLPDFIFIYQLSVLCLCVCLFVREKRIQWMALYLTFGFLKTDSMLEPCRNAITIPTSLLASEITTEVCYTPFTYSDISYESLWITHIHRSIRFGHFYNRFKSCYKLLRAIYELLWCIYSKIPQFVTSCHG